MSFSGSFTTPVKKVKQVKRLACETWWNYSPVNSTSFNAENIIKFQIPTTDAIFDLSRAFITLDYRIPVKLVDILKDNKTTRTPQYKRLVDGDITTTNFDKEMTFKLAPKIGTLGDLGSSDTHLLNITDFGGFTNAATIFSLTEMYMDGNLISHDDYCQTQARLWQENKNQSWIEAQKQTFFSPSAKFTDRSFTNEYSTIFSSFILNKNNVLPPSVNSGTKDHEKYYYVTKQLKIPLVMLFPQFEVLNGWPSFLVKQILYLQLTVSDPSKYFTSFYSPDYTSKKNLNVLDINTRNSTVKTANPYLKAITASFENGRNPIFGFDMPANFSSDSDALISLFEFDIDNVQLENVVLYLPTHVPEFKERQEYEALVNNGLSYGFKSYNVLSNTFDLSINTSGSNTLAQSYNSSVNNLEAVNILTMRDGTEVVYDKPSVSALQCNLGNSWMQAASGTHVENLYNFDADLYTDLLKGWGQYDKPYYNTISENITKSYKANANYLYYKEPTTNTAIPLSVWGISPALNEDGKVITSSTFFGNAGSYTSYFDVSPADELGVASGQYSKLINLRFNSEYPSSVPSAAQVVGDDSRCSFSNAKIYVCQQTFSLLSITPTSVFITNPFAGDFDTRNLVMQSKNLNMQANGFRSHGFTSPHGFTQTHGFAALLGPAVEFATNFIPSIVGGIKKLDERAKSRRLSKFKTKAMKELGQDGYKHYEKEINHWGQYIRPISKRKLKQWKKDWKSKNASVVPTQGPSTEHGVFKKYIPGTYIKKFRVMSQPRITPGWRGGVNRRPIRLQPFGRLAAVPAMSGSMISKHGLEPPYHGFLKNIWNKTKDYFKKKIPSRVTDVLDPLKPYAQPIIDSLKPKISDKFNKFDNAFTDKINSKIPGVGRKTKRLRKWFKNTMNNNHGMNNKAIEKILANRFYTKGALLRGVGRTGKIMNYPHVKKVKAFWKDYYGRKHGANLLRLQKHLSRQGAQRQFEGMY